MTRPLAVGLQAWLLAVAAMVFLAGPGIVLGAELVGNGTSDVWSHAWSYAWVARALGQAELPLAGAPVGFPEGVAWVLVDAPVAVLVAPVAALVGPASAYNAAVLGQVGLVAGAAAWWGRMNGARPGLCIAAGLAVALSPFTLGVVATGVPEVLAFGVIPVLVESTRRGLQGHKGWMVAACGAALWISASGAYGVLMAALPAALLVGASAVRRQWGAVARAAPIALCGVLPLGLVLAAMRVVEHPVLRLEARPFREPVDPALWAWAALKGADLLNFVAPAPLLPDPAAYTLHRHATYLGLALVFAATLAAVRLPRARWLLVLAATALLLALGPMLVVAGTPLLPLPWGVADLGLHHVYRLAGLAVLCLTGAALLLAETQWARRRGWVVVGAVLVALEWAALSPVRGVPTTPDPAGPVELALAGQGGAVVDLPFDRIGRYPLGAWPQRAFYLQAVHGLPVASAPYRPPPVLDGHPTLTAVDSFLVQALAATPGYAMPVGPGLAPTDRLSRPLEPLKPPPTPRLARDRLALVDQGFGWLVLHRDAVPPRALEQLEPFLLEWLGPPALDLAGRAVWDLEAAPP